jgi:hypothetical protein
LIGFRDFFFGDFADQTNPFTKGDTAHVFACVVKNLLPRDPWYQFATSTDNPLFIFH